MASDETKDIRPTGETVRAFRYFATFQVVLFSAVAAFVVWHDSRDSRQNSPSAPVEVRTPQATRYVRNVTWKTGFSENTPFRKGEEVEILYSVDAETAPMHALDFRKLAPSLDVLRVEVDGTALGRVPSGILPFGPKGVVKIVAKTKTGALLSPKDVSEVSFDEEVRADEIPPEIPAHDPAATGSGMSEPERPAAGSSNAGGMTVSPLSYSLDVSNVVRVSNPPKGILSVVLGDRRFDGRYEAGAYVFVVPERAFSAGEKFLAFSMSDGKLLPSDIHLSFDGGEANLGVAAVTPSAVPSDRESYVTLQGHGFSKALSLQLQNGVVIRGASFEIVNDSVMIVKIPAGLSSGTYAFNVMDVSGIYTPVRAKFSVITP